MDELGSFVDDLCKNCKRRPIDRSRSIRSCTVCLDKAIERGKVRNERHPDYFREHYKNNLAKYREYQKSRYTDPEKHKKALEYSRDYWNRTKDIKNEQRRLARKADPEGVLVKERASKKKWREKNRNHINEKSREYEFVRRARVVNAGGSFSPSEWEEIKALYGNRCLCCLRGDVQLCADHVVPIALGGSNTIDNIQPLCRSCNSRKHAKIIDYRPQYT